RRHATTLTGFRRSFPLPRAPRPRLWPMLGGRRPTVARRRPGMLVLFPRQVVLPPRRGSSSPACPVHPWPDSLAAVIHGFSDAEAEADTDGTVGTLRGA